MERASSVVIVNEAFVNNEHFIRRTQYPLGAPRRDGTRTTDSETVPRVCGSSDRLSLHRLVVCRAVGAGLFSPIGAEPERHDTTIFYLQVSSKQRPNLRRESQKSKKRIIRKSEPYKYKTNQSDIEKLMSASQCPKNHNSIDSNYYH